MIEWAILISFIALNHLLQVPHPGVSGKYRGIKSSDPFRPDGNYEVRKASRKRVNASSSPKQCRERKSFSASNTPAKVSFPTTLTSSAGGVEFEAEGLKWRILLRSQTIPHWNYPLLVTASNQ